MKRADREIPKITRVERTTRVIRATRKEKLIRPKGPNWYDPRAENQPFKTGLTIESKLKYYRRTANIVGAIEARWYYIGSVVVAFVHVNDEQTPPGKYVLHQPHQGNTGRPFPSEKSLHDYLVSELES